MLTGAAGDGDIAQAENPYADVGRGQPGKVHFTAAGNKLLGVGALAGVIYIARPECVQPNFGAADACHVEVARSRKRGIARRPCADIGGDIARTIGTQVMQRWHGDRNAHTVTAAPSHPLFAKAGRNAIPPGPEKPDFLVSKKMNWGSAHENAPCRLLKAYQIEFDNEKAQYPEHRVVKIERSAGDAPQHCTGEGCRI